MSWAEKCAVRRAILSEGVRAAVDVGWDEEKGGIALAKRDYMAGEVVFVDEPIMVVDVEDFPPGAPPSPRPHQTQIEAW